MLGPQTDLPTINELSETHELYPAGMRFYFYLDTYSIRYAGSLDTAVALRARCVHALHRYDSGTPQPSQFAGSAVAPRRRGRLRQITPDEIRQIVEMHKRGVGLDMPQRIARRLTKKAIAHHFHISDTQVIKILDGRDYGDVSGITQKNITKVFDNDNRYGII